MKFDIPINISVETTTEEKAEKFVFDFLKMATKEFGVEQRIINWEYFEFLPKESCSSGCRNNHQ